MTRLSQHAEEEEEEERENASRKKERNNHFFLGDSTLFRSSRFPSGGTLLLLNYLDSSFLVLLHLFSLRTTRSARTRKHPRMQGKTSEREKSVIQHHMRMKEEQRKKKKRNSKPSR